MEGFSPAGVRAGHCPGGISGGGCAEIFREEPDKARTLTCADQFTANKSTNGNGGLKWIEKSGGYYSECVVRLKG